MGMMARMIVPLVDRLVVTPYCYVDECCFVEMKRTEERPRLCRRYIVAGHTEISKGFLEANLAPDDCK